MTALRICLLLLFGLVARAAPTVELKVELGHAGSIQSVAFSPNGRWALTGSADKTALLWDVATGHEIRRLEGHSGEIDSVAISPDGRFALSGSKDQTAILWDLSSGQSIRHLQGHSAAVQAVTFSPDGKSALTAGDDRTARLWDLATGREIRRFEGHTLEVDAVAFSRDGRFALTGSHDRTARLWDVATGREIRRLEGHTFWLSSVAFSKDGRTALTGSHDKTARLWDLDTGREIRRFEGHASFVLSVAFAPDERTMLTGSWDSTARIWNLATGREIRRFEGESNAVYEAAFSPDGRIVLTACYMQMARLFDVATGREIRQMGRHAGGACGVRFSPDGRMILITGSDRIGRLWNLTMGREVLRLEEATSSLCGAVFAPDGTSALVVGKDSVPRLFDTATGRIIRRFETNSVASVAISPDGRSALTGGTGGSVEVWDMTTGRLVRRLTGSSPNSAFVMVASVVFSPDGKSALSGGLDKTIRLWDVDSGREIRRMDAQPGWISSVSFSPDGRSALAAGMDDATRLWDLSNGREIRRLAYNQSVSSAVFSKDGTMALTGSFNDTARLWDVATGREIRHLGSVSDVMSWVTFSPDGRFMLTACRDGMARLWDLNGRLLATLLSFSDPGWAVTDAEGRYDASDPDHSPALHWQLGDEVIELSQLKQRFYTPNLLGRALGLQPEPLPAVAGLKDLRLPPAATVTEPRPGQSVATVRLTDRGGGIGRVVVKVNGREMPVLTRGTAVRSNVPVAVDLKGAQLAANGENTIEVFVYDKANLLSSRGVSAVWKQAPDKAAAPPALHAIVAGVSNYAGDAMSLKFPAKDAQDMAHALEIGGKRMFGVERVDIAMLASGTNREPTKENIRRAFEEIPAKAGPNDVVLIYLAGHGVAGKAGSDLYYYLTRDARTVKPEDDAKLWAQTTVSSAELLEWLRRKGMPLRQVVVLDTCAAGAAGSALLKLADRRELTADQRRALELLKDATGSHILMGAAADKVSYEANRYGQGLLTYSLLLGMRGEALDEGGRLDVMKWFHTAQVRVPEFAQGIGGIQQPVISSPGGQTFPVAMFTPEDRTRIVLPALKPQLLRALVLDSNLSDPLQLEAPVRAELRALSVPATRGEPGKDVRPEPPLVYLDETAGDVADAFKPKVLYVVDGDAVRVRVRLESAKATPERSFTASTHDVTGLAKRVAREIVEMLR